MRIAVCDYRVQLTSPSGSQHLCLLEGLCDEHEFVVFAGRFDNPRPDRIEFVRVLALPRPLVALYLSYYVGSWLARIAYRLRGGAAFDLVQTVEDYTPGADLAYVHFGHRGFLRRGGAGSTGRSLRNVVRWLDHAVRALMEPGAYARARAVVVVSDGLRTELEAELPALAGRIRVIPNGIDTRRFARPMGHSRDATLAEVGVPADSTVLVFAALGHFERKGLPLILEALAGLKAPGLHLLVVGGDSDLIAAYRSRVASMRIADRVSFIGTRPDFERFLWAGDALVHPSAYEAFPLVIWCAAAAGMPLILTPVHGVRDHFTHGVDALIVARDVASLSAAITDFLAMPPAERQRLGAQAVSNAGQYGRRRFIGAWRALYQELAPVHGLASAQRLGDLAPAGTAPPEGR